VIRAKEWYKMFVEEFKRAAGDKATEIGMMYEKDDILESWGFEVRDLSTDWTHCMSVFLARMARKKGYVQDWEFQQTDLCWLQKNKTDPPIAIEPNYLHIRVRQHGSGSRCGKNGNDLGPENCWTTIRVPLDCGEISI
jgi:hypothetical protein